MAAASTPEPTPASSTAPTPSPSPHPEPPPPKGKPGWPWLKHATSQADLAAAHELQAKTLLLQSQLGYVQANGETTEAMGQTPE
jgi:hypothetical protein